MRALPLLLLLTACATDPAEVLPTDAAPPPVFQLTAPATAAPGGTLTVQISGTLGEDEEVELMVGRGGLGAGPCPRQYGNLCLDVVNPVTVGRGLVDAAGNVTISVTVPAGAPLGGSFGLQAVVTRGRQGSRSVKSTTDTFVIANGPTSPLTFSYTGAPQTFVVPAGVTSIEVEACGGSGGDGWNVDVDTPLGFGGQGAFAAATVPVTPGESLTVTVGSAGGDAAEAIPGIGGYPGGGGGAQRLGYAGGGGGGASDLRRGTSLAARLLVAAGGGAGSGWCTNGSGNGGSGGAPTGVAGSMCSSLTPGGGGTQSAGGAGGAGAASGAAGAGGAASTDAGAGGGDGYFGGGGSNGSGAGGGSSFAAPSLIAPDLQTGGCVGDGSVTISW